MIRRQELRLTAMDYGPEHFGDAFIVLDGDHYSIRVVRDRSQTFVDLASRADPDNWFGVERVLAAITGRSEAQTTLSLGDAATEIEVSGTALAKHLASDRYPETLQKLEQLGEIARRRFLR